MPRYCVFWIPQENEVTYLHSNIFHVQLKGDFTQVTIFLTQHLKLMRLNRTRKSCFGDYLPRVKQLETGKDLTQIL